MRVTWICMCIICCSSVSMLFWTYLYIAVAISQLITRKYVIFLFFFLKRWFCFYSKEGIPFLHRLTITYLINVSFGHIGEFLSETFHTIKTSVYLIQFLQMDFEIPCNLMTPNTCIIPRCLSYRQHYASQ